MKLWMIAITSYTTYYQATWVDVYDKYNDKWNVRVGLCYIDHNLRG